MRVELLRERREAKRKSQLLREVHRGIRENGSRRDN